MVVNIPKYVLCGKGVTDFGSLVAAVLFIILGKLPWNNDNDECIVISVYNIFLNRKKDIFYTYWEKFSELIYY